MLGLKRFKTVQLLGGEYAVDLASLAMASLCLGSCGTGVLAP